VGQNCEMFTFSCIVMESEGGSGERGWVGQDCNVFTFGCIVMEREGGSGERGWVGSHLNVRDLADNEMSRRVGAWAGWVRRYCKTFEVVDIKRAGIGGGVGEAELECVRSRWHCNVERERERRWMSSVL
jgi:hypothetical protein